MASAIIIAACIVGGVGIIIGIVLGIAGEKFKVEVDPKEEAILDVLPGNNCGACGYPGCSGLAAAIAKGEAPVNQCPVGGPPVAEQVGAIMGVSAGETKRMVAYVKCDGRCGVAKEQYNYSGVQDCVTAAYMQAGGPKACSYGCMGFGSCVDVCPFDAIHVVDGVAVVDKENCKACEKCVNICPNHVIEMIPYDTTHSVKCNSNGKAKEVRDACDVGCIACRLCEKNCPFDAVHVEDNLAKIDYDKCKHCGICAAVCPRHIIIGKRAKNVPKKKPAAKKSAGAAAKPKFTPEQIEQMKKEAAAKKAAKAAAENGAAAKPADTAPKTAETAKPAEAPKAAETAKTAENAKSADTAPKAEAKSAEAPKAAEPAKEAEKTEA